jgi:hypothetical protein
MIDFDDKNMVYVMSAYAVTFLTFVILFCIVFIKWRCEKRRETLKNS